MNHFDLIEIMKKMQFPANFKIFWMTFIAVFIVVALQQMGVRAPQLVNPLPASMNTFQDLIRPKLEQKVNTYKIKKHSSFLRSAYAAASYDNLRAYAVIDYDSGDVILDKGLSNVLPIASLTKIMTAVVVMDLVSPDELFTVSQEVEHIVPTKLGAPPGEKFTVYELLQALLMTSANDSATILQYGIDNKYGQNVFIRAMNKKAEVMGLKNTSFDNPQGFDGVDNFSSVEDLSILTHYALTHYPVISEIVKKDVNYLEANEYHGRYTLYNWNGLVGVYPNIVGVKIGNTGRAGKTTIVLSERDNKKLLVVALGAPGIIERDLWASQLLDAGYKEAKGLEAINLTEFDLRVKYATWL